MRRYQCKDCGRKFQNRRRQSQPLQRLWADYVWRRATLAQLSRKYRRSISWIRRKLDRAPSRHKVEYVGQPVVIVADATFWGRGYGVIVFRSQDLKRNLYWMEIATETAQAYREGREFIEYFGYTIDAVVIDGKRGVKGVFADVPVQLCQFHQIKTVNFYLTRRPKLPAGRELRSIALALTKTDELAFTVALHDWHERWKEFLKERTTNPETGRWFYTHRRIRSAYRSLKTNLPYLFTCQKYPDLHIPNTTNSLDGTFSHLKDLLQFHRGLKNSRRYKIINEVLINHRPSF